MVLVTSYATQRLTIIAQDPAVRVDGRILKAEVEIPAEELAPGPWGYRVNVIDYDTTSKQIYKPVEYERSSDGLFKDPYQGASDHALLSDPGFHAQNVYAIVMRILARFEYALGRRVSWSFGRIKSKSHRMPLRMPTRFIHRATKDYFSAISPANQGPYSVACHMTWLRTKRHMHCWMAYVRCTRSPLRPTKPHSTRDLPM